MPLNKYVITKKNITVEGAKACHCLDIDNKMEAWLPMHLPSYHQQLTKVKILQNSFSFKSKLILPWYHMYY